MILVTALLFVVALVASPASPAAARSTQQAATSTAGSLQADFNHDGFIDSAVGVPFEDIGTITDAGAVDVLYGSASGLTPAGSRAFWQGTGGAAGVLEAGDLFGWALAAGDFNNDGFADLAVGAPGEDIGSIRDAGAVDVLYGSASGLTPAGSRAFWQGTGGAAGVLEAGDLLGSALAAGDFNNDRSADLAVGAPGEDIGTITDAGAVDVQYGSASGLTPAGSRAFWQGTGGAAGVLEATDAFGSALAAGDFNRDGFADLAVGVPTESIGISVAGAVDVLYGSASGLTPSGSRVFWQGASGVPGLAQVADLFGSALAAGDFNHDGFADLGVGVPGDEVSGAGNPGAIDVLYGSAGGLTGTGSRGFWQGTGGAAGAAENDDGFGSALAAGDFNHNGFDDLAIGVQREDIGTIPDAGAVDVLYGSAGGLTGAGSQVLWQGTGGAAGIVETNDRFGFAVAAGDFNHNGYPDLTVGVWLEDIGAIRNAGAVDVLYGSADGLTGAGSRAFWQGTGGAAGVLEADDEFGQALVGADLATG
jgi:FG-GAP repeat